MDEKYEVSLQSNTKLSKLIDTNLQKESALLQSLIKDVVDANKKVKASHEKRVQESKQRLEQLNRDIRDLNAEINRKEKDTTMAQLNYLLDSKNKIYEALQTMRQKNIDVYLSRDSIVNIQPLSDHLFNQLNTHTSSGNDILPIMETLREKIIDIASQGMTRIRSLMQETHGEDDPLKTIIEAINDSAFQSGALFLNLKESLKELEANRAHILKDTNSDESLESRIEETFETRKKALEKESQALQKEFKTNKNALLEEKNQIYDQTLKNLQAQYQSKLEAEENTRVEIENKIKMLRLDIIKAEKDKDDTRTKQLFKQYEKYNRKKPNFLEDKLESKAETQSKKAIKRIDHALYNLEKDYLIKHNALRFEISKIHIERSDSKDLFKVREDFKGLESDLSYNKSLEKLLTDHLNNFKDAIEKLFEQVESIHEVYIKREYRFLKQQLSLLDDYKSLEHTFKSSQLNLSNLMRKKQFSNQKLSQTVLHDIKKHALQIDKHQKLSKIDKRIIDIKNTNKIDQLYAEEDIQNEKIYQNARIELADQEYELQLLKIKSLYDNEIGLTKAQADRLNIGYEVNESMVATTYESQILFAKQQIEYAESEFELRLENIELSLNKEKEYAQDKLNEHQQKYKTDKIDLINERDRKLEDLSYKQALFTEDKDKRLLSEQEEKITHFYNDKIEKIESAMQEDPYVKRYKKQLDNADKRAEKAREDARQIRDKSSETFKSMLQSSEEKLNQFKNNSEHDSLKPMIESEEGTAKNRLHESIEDAKALYEEKIKGPNDKLRQLDDQLTTIYDEQSLNHKLAPLIEEKASIEASIKASQKALNDTLNQVLNTIKSEEDTFDAAYNDALKKLENQSFSAAVSLNEASIKKRLSSLRNAQTESLNALKTTLNETLEGFETSLPKHIKALDQAIMPAYKAYDNYLTRLSGSIKTKEQQVKKAQDKSLKDSLKSLSKTYK